MSLNALLAGLKAYYKQAEDVEKIILNCAMVAAGAAGVGGVIPVFSIPSMIVSCVGAVWAMYIKICNCLEIKLSENLLRILASAALSNIAVNLVSAFAAELIFSFVPGASIATSALITFCSVYLAGVMFVKMILAFAKQGKTGKTLESVSQSTFEAVLKDQTMTKSDVKKAKGEYNKEKDK